MNQVPEEVVTEFANRRSQHIDDVRDYIDKFLIEDARKLVADGVSLIDALEAVSVRRDEYDFRGALPEHHLCVDCGVNTAPGLLSRREIEEAARALGPRWHADEGISQRIDCDSEVYFVRHAVWKKAGMTPWGGCLCIGCLETRLGRRLKPKDFLRDHPFNSLPGTERLMKRRGQKWKQLQFSFEV